MKKIITSVLIGLALYFVYPIVAKFITNHHLLVLAITAGVLSYVIGLIMDRFN